MQLNKTATNKTATTAAKPATAGGKQKKTGTAGNKVKAKKSPLDRAFITATALKRSAERLTRLTAGWVAGTGADGKTEDRHVAAVLMQAGTGLDSATKAADVVLAALMALVNAGFAPAKTRAPKVELTVGSHVVIKEKALERFDYLTSQQLANLYICHVDEDRGFLVLARSEGQPDQKIGYFKKSILKAAGEVETSEEDESDDNAE